MHETTLFPHHHAGPLNVPNGGVSGSEYLAWLEAVARRFATNAKDGARPMFRTSAAGLLWSLYLDTFPAGSAERQHYTCSACRHFFDYFGDLAFVDDDGRLVPAAWSVDDAPMVFKPAVEAIERTIRRARIVTPFLSAEAVLGSPVTHDEDHGCDWNHFAVRVPASRVYRGRGLTARQRMAELREDFRTLNRALDEFTPEQLAQAVAVLEADALYRSEKVLGGATWLQARKLERAAPNGSNRTWSAVVDAPAGFCHPRSSMIGTLLEDIAAGLPFDDIARRFAAKMHPLRYQRPQAAPATGAIEAAEALVQRLALEPSFYRRPARLDEVEALWRPRAPAEPAASGLFGALKANAGQAVKPLGTPERVVSWTVFARDILPRAESIDVHLNAGSNMIAGFMTATNADAPPILQWDREDDRNPVSWYFYHGGSYPSRWNLAAGWNRVAAVTLKPSAWKGRELSHQGRAVAFLVAGAADQSDPTLALFPEILRSDLHGIRSVVEAFSRSRKPDPELGVHAAGPMYEDAKGARLRVTIAGVSQDVTLDRWE